MNVKFILALAQKIREVDGDNSLGASALAEELTPFLEEILMKEFLDPYIEALADCRDSFPEPQVSSSLEHFWAEAMSDPLAVPAYIEAWLMELQT